MASAASPASPAIPGFGARPTSILSFATLIRISMFWLGLTAIDSVVGAAVQARIKFDGLVPVGTEGSSLAVIAVAQLAFAIAVQPTVGSISDYTSTRWGRRKPYIVFGASFDALFLIGIATANTFLAVIAFVTLLSLSTNIARGPFQGYVPDLVPEPQVGLASALVGLFQVFGNVLGFALAAIATTQGNVGIAIFAIAAVEIVTMLSVVLRVPNGPPARPREGRSWLSIAAETWGTDILREKSYIWLLASRLFILMGGAAVLNFIFLYLADVHSLTESQSGGAFLQMLAATTVFAILSIVPAARLSDRIGRKPVIYGCTAIGAFGLAVIAFAPSIEIATIGAAFFGASQGTFLAVDWALMTDIIPMASSGRYMGLSNVVTASSTTIAVAIGGPLIDILNRTIGIGFGERAEITLGIVYFAVGALCLRSVREPPRSREGRPPPHADPATGTATG